MKKETLRALETLNYNRIKLVNSREYIIGNKIYKLLNELREKKITLQIHKLKKKTKLKKIKNSVNPYNLTMEEWEKSVQQGDLKIRVVVYTCITGGYDQPKNPMYYPENVDYVLFTTENYGLNENWLYRDIPNKIKALEDNKLINRYIKLHPQELFENEYDVSIYIDGNITVVSDLSYYSGLIDQTVGIAMHSHASRNCIYEEGKVCKILGKGNSGKIDEQLKKYSSLEFPKEYGMSECNVIVTDLHNEKATEISNQWWEELLKSGSERDQLSFPYILWKNNISLLKVNKLGKNVHRNTKFIVSEHSG